MSHKSHQRPKSPRDRDRVKPAVQQNVQSRVNLAYHAIAQPNPQETADVSEPDVKDAQLLIDEIVSPPVTPPSATAPPPAVPTVKASAAVPPEPLPGRHTTQRTPTPQGELSDLFESLRELFVRDRANGARGDAQRCGICYLTFPREQLRYREEEGFYACLDCETVITTQRIVMLRRQRK